ncbi:MAG: LuxR C-terminal-related transcriptional regulator [Pseudomonadota bacterium]
MNAAALFDQLQYYYLINSVALGTDLTDCLSTHQATLLSQTYTDAHQNAPPGLVQASWAFGVHQGMTLGWRCEHIGAMTLFSFLGNAAALQSDNFVVLRAVIPHLHAALTRCAARMRSGRAVVDLTGREREILQWILAGKTSWEISRILAISQRTVTYHVQNAMSKLGASTRSQAVANAARMGLLQLN